ncbi:hypothetical protein N7471_000925 [Penicillium samsonianum]|uniref:uncharacterized protein n=1 Tax=Penicillium samsonianum TaxID=1882272 RepID=UPI002546AC23|nr:uncharacterized protein N7471_000925 [Penicillium samsonianum]KAJ6149726.1 hypothetical protein N7471_000925 [Penicillium samsonianum]
MYHHPAAEQNRHNPLGLPIYECWFCPTSLIGFSGLEDRWDGSQADSQFTNVALMTGSSATKRIATPTWTTTTIGWNGRPILDSFALSGSARSK